MKNIRVGAACKWVDEDGVNVPEANFRSTSVRHLRDLKPSERHAKLLEILKHNTWALRHQLANVALLPKAQHMWRIGSDLLPIATHEITHDFYRDRDVDSLISKRLAWCGAYARKRGIRLSFHPGQFVVLASQNPGVRENSRAELQYHVDCFERMGYSGWHPDGLAVNIHVGVKNADVKSMRKLLKSSTGIANFVTLENDEFSWGAQMIADTFGDLVPVVLDVHHHWINAGKRIQPSDPLVDTIRDTWRGVQPKLHLAMSHPELCEGTRPNAKLNIMHLFAAGHTKAKLRAHSTDAWHTRSIDYAAGFGFDIMAEFKSKNLASTTIAKHLGLI